MRSGLSLVVMMNRVVWGNENPDGPEPCVEGCKCFRHEFDDVERCACGAELKNDEIEFCFECI